jgi:ATP-binding cassette, subfamily C, bacterial PrsD
MSKPMAAASAADNPVVQAMAATRSSWIHVAVFSSIVNILMLTGSIYMLQVYDRVLSSRAVPTLIGLSIIAVIAFALQGIMDASRQKLLGRIGALVDERLAPLAAKAMILTPLRGGKPSDAVQPMRDLDSLRGFLGGLGPTAIIDMPFMPLFLGACFLLHPWLGWLAIGGAVIIISLTLIIERRTAKSTQTLIRTMSERHELSESGRRSAQAIVGLGMIGAFSRRFDKAHTRYVGDSLAMAESSGALNAFAKIFRLLLQSAVLGVGAYLAIKGEMSAGAMIAASILTSRALAPIELSVAHWKSFIGARQAYARLKVGLANTQAPDLTMQMPAPRQSLGVQELAVVAPGTQQPIIQGVTFGLKAGQGLGLIGPSGSGKSTLARALVGAWAAARGSIMLDGAKIGQWETDVLGRSLGYLPQDVELLDGTIAENIARFQPGEHSEEIIKAATEAGAHQMIVAFPQGYDTRIGEGGQALSGGQRQRIALARALFGEPFLVVLDEPNASLDADGDQALNRAIRAVRARGGIVIVVTHRSSGLAAVDLVGAMADGRMTQFGPRDDVMQKIMQANTAGGARQAGARSGAPLAAVPMVRGVGQFPPEVAQ